MSEIETQPTELTEVELKAKLEAIKKDKLEKGLEFLNSWLKENDFKLQTAIPVIIGGQEVGISLVNI